MFVWQRILLFVMLRALPVLATDNNHYLFFMIKKRARLNGFTLIEISIVLVVIGLVVGGLLVGRDLISSASLRAQISQLEKYQQASNAFRGKYNALPGDIPNPDAITFGFIARGAYEGEGDGNGFIEGISNTGGGHNWGVYQSAGETVMFWVDLSTAKMIPDAFNTATPATPTSQTITDTTSPSIGKYLPSAMIGQGNRIEVWGYHNSAYFTANLLGIVNVSSIAASGASSVVGNNGLTVLQAYNIDSKMDDGLPQSGTVLAAWGQPSGTGWVGALSGTSATAASSTTCYDNNNVNGVKRQYSILQSNGAGVNCALSLKLQ